MKHNNLDLLIKRYLAELDAHRRRIHRFDPESVVVAVTERLRYIGGDIQRVQQSPYNNLYHMLKLSVQGSHKRYAQQRQFTLDDMRKLLPFYNSPDFPHLEISERDGDPICMKLNFFAACQFAFQVRIGTTDIGRTVYLFRDSAWSFDVEQAFKETTGIRTEDFLLGGMMLYSCSLKEPYITWPQTDIPLDVCKEGTWEAFLCTIALTFDKFRSKLEQFDLRSELFEFASPPLLEKYPVLILSGQRLLVPWAPFVASRLCYGIYDILKESHGNDFTQAFGEVFQSYVGRLLQLVCEANGLQLIRDRELSRDEEQPDFAIVDGDCLIVIEVKAVEDRLYLDSGRLASSTQDTLGKAAQQCDALWGRYLEGREPVFPSGLNTCIPVIVTWRPFFWANDRFYREAVFAPKFSHESLVQTCQTINIRDFEDLVATVLNSRREFGELLSIKSRSKPEDDWRGFIVEILGKETISKENFVIPGVTDRFDVLLKQLIEALRSS